MVDVEKRIKSNDEVEIRRGIHLLLQGSDGVNGIGFPFAPDFDIREIERRCIGNSKTDHFVSSGSRRKRLVLLMGRVTGRDEQHSIQLQPVPDFASNGQVTIVDRIECTAQQA
jgi:hypothetical protein